MKKHSSALTRFLGLCLLIVFSTAGIASPQTALERLEQQIRQRVGQQPPPPQPGISPPRTTASGTKQVVPAEKRTPGYLGVIADDRLDRGRGVRVLEVQADGPAAKDGLKKQDLITSVASVRTRQMSEMSDVLNLYVTGESVEFEILRDNKPQKVKVTLGNRPPQKSSGSQNPEAIPLPPGEVMANEPPQRPPKDTSKPEEAKKPSMLELFKLRSVNPGEKKNAEPEETAKPDLLLPNNTASEDHPTVERLQKRIEELERRVAELEKALEEAKEK